MMTPGAADTDRQVGLALRLKAGDEKRQQLVDSVHELLGSLGGEDILTYRLVNTPEILQLRDPVGVGEKPDVEQKVDVAGRTVLETE
jgi:hypothetical protein